MRRAHPRGDRAGYDHLSGGWDFARAMLVMDDGRLSPFT
jgi:hypothetical protein